MLGAFSRSMDEEICSFSPFLGCLKLLEWNMEWNGEMENGMEW